MSRVAGVQYSLAAPTRRCASSGREIAPGEKFVAALTQSLETSEFVRLDFLLEAWEAGARPVKGLVLLGFWKSVAIEGEKKRQLLIDDDSLLELFEQTEEATDRERMVFRLVLALILLRKRLLVQEGSRGTTMLVRQRGIPRPPEGPAYREVVDPGLDETSVLNVTAQLAAVLAGEEAGAASGQGVHAANGGGGA